MHEPSTTEYRARTLAVLDGNTVLLSMPIRPLSRADAVSTGQDALWEEGWLRNPQVVRLQGLSPAPAGSAAHGWLSALLPEGTLVILRTEGAELLPGGEWAGCLWTNPDGSGLPVNIKAALASATAATARLGSSGSG